MFSYSGTCGAHLQQVLGDKSRLYFRQPVGSIRDASTSRTSQRICISPLSLHCRQVEAAPAKSHLYRELHAGLNKASY